MNLKLRLLLQEAARQVLRGLLAGCVATAIALLIIWSLSDGQY